MNTDKKGLGFTRVHRCSSVTDLSLRSQAQSDSSSRPKLWVDLRSPETHLGGAGREEQRTVPAGNVSGGRTQERQQECRRCRLKSAPRRSPVVSTRCPEVSGKSRPCRQEGPRHVRGHISGWRGWYRGPPHPWRVALCGLAVIASLEGVGLHSRLRRGGAGTLA